MYRKTSFRLSVLTALLTTMTSVISEKLEMTRFETVHNSNAAILQRLGLVPLRIPDGHHKKRLSGPEPSSDVMDIALSSQTRIHQPYGRRHGHRDSHVYVVKLPPSQPYYTLTKPHKATSLSNKDNDRVTTNKRIIAGNTSPNVGFQSNGKPGKIYHWNLPLVKKISEKKRLRNQSKMEQIRDRHENEMNDQFLENNKDLGQQLNDKKNVTMFYNEKKPTSNVSSAKKSSITELFNSKRYHHSTFVNSLNNNEKPRKHTRNNDKRLNYPRIPEQLRKSGRPSEKNNDKETIEDKEKTSKNNKKMYRLEDSNLYRLESYNNNNERHKNERLAVWNLSNELHASVNTQSSTRPKKHRKKSAMSYYAPINSRINNIDPSTATKIQKNFPGNGKPKAFYVMEKSRQPIYYHPLLP